MEFDISPWFLIVVVGMIVLGVAIAYGLTRSKSRSAADRQVTEQATQRMYDREDRSV